MPCRQDTSVRLFQRASRYQVVLPTGEKKRLCELDYWQLLDLTINTMLLNKKISKTKGSKR